jgi:type II secretory pathway component GspD/PulD (secretin)
LYLSNSTGQRDANDIQTDLRNVLPKTRIYFVGSGNAISIRGSAEDIALAQKILAEIDRPQKTYRLTYTIGDGENGHAPQRFIVVVAQGSKTMLKQGTRVPIVTGTYKDGAASNPQVQYVDVGINLDASPEGSGDGLRLRTKIEESSVAEEKSSVGIQDPVLHQSVLEGESAVVTGKPVVLGSIDANGKRMEISVVADTVK